MANPERKTRGRQKVAMVRMEKESNRLVTFSKRRSGLFKKASELCTLCSAEAAIIVFSPGRKAFSFGHPSVDVVVNRYFGENPSQAPEAHQDNIVSRFNTELTLLTHRSEVEKKHYEELVQQRKAKGEELWWIAAVEELELPHLKQLQGPITELRDKVIQFGNRLVGEVTGTNGNALPFLAPNPMESGYHFPACNSMDRENPFAGQSSILMVPNPMGRGPNDHPPMVMIPTPMGGFGDPMLPLGSDGSGMSRTNPSSSMPTPIGGFDDLNLLPFQGVNNPIGEQIDAPPIPMQLNLGMNPPVAGNQENFTSLMMSTNPPVTGNPESFTSLLMSANPMDAMHAPTFNPQGGFGPGFF